MKYLATLALLGLAWLFIEGAPIVALVLLAGAGIAVGVRA